MFQVKVIKVVIEVELKDIRIKQTYIQKYQKIQIMVEVVVIVMVIFLVVLVVVVDMEQMVLDIYKTILLVVIFMEIKKYYYQLNQLNKLKTVYVLKTIKIKIKI